MHSINDYVFFFIPFQTNEADRGPQESVEGNENPGEVVHMLAARTIVIDKSVIKGYHAFKIRPPLYYTCASIIY